MDAEVERPYWPSVGPGQRESGKLKAFHTTPHKGEEEEEVWFDTVALLSRSRVFLIFSTFRQPELSKTSDDSPRYLPYRRPGAPSPPAASIGPCRRARSGSNGSSAMTTPDLTPGQRQPSDPESNRECKRYKATETDDESTLIDDCDIADITDLDDEGFRLVRHRKERTVGIPVIITPVTEGADLKKVNPIALSTEIEEILGASPVRSRFTAQGALLLDVQTEEHVNALLSCKSISGTAISARVPNSYLQNTCIIRGVPKWYTDEELLNYLKPQGVYHARRVTRRVQTSESEWESRRTSTVVLTFAPNTDRPEKINLGFTRHETIDYVETPPRCFKCQRYGHVAKYCRGDQRSVNVFS
ncbi:hypothetical protein HPB49_020456 [Dermacentor silvarum]|uniref:Uncharacterized protein n=1 Tax=Dermacentor silvarum TaxID=543639 RepID=A0ACB8DKW9_DERSI|nr:hypothetical protein HPB49_020456 [Dermacentor silvarum]